MKKLIKKSVLGQRITEITYTEQSLLSFGIVKNYFLLLESKLIIQLLPFGLRAINDRPQQTILDQSNEAQQCLNKIITAVVTDTCFYSPASIDELLQNPPYDDVCLILNKAFWMANRFFINTENSLTIDNKEELQQISKHYFDYWTREEVCLDNLFD